MTGTEPTVFRTAKEAEAWLRANPMRGVKGKKYKYRFNDSRDYIEVFYCREWTKADAFDLQAPYTVIPDKTITINGKQYREGDIANINASECKGCTVKVLDHYAHNYDLEFIHIPDELADKPQEPKTLTFEEAQSVDEIWVIRPYDGYIFNWLCQGEWGFTDYYTLKAHVDNGGHLYASEADAELGKARGWK